MTANELAELLHANTRTFANWRTNDRGPAFVKIGAHVRYRHADVDAWLEERTVSDTPEAKALR